MNILRKIRVTLALLIFVATTLLFLDFTGTLHAWLGWIARIQLLPALLALNASVIIVLLLLTLLFGRLYCSIICPLGVLQDFAARTNPKKHRFTYSAPLKWLRYGVLMLFVLAFIIGISALVNILEPYSAFGRIASNLLSPLYQLANNLLAVVAERVDSYAFYATEVWIKSLSTFAIAALTLIIVSFLAWRSGRSYCNTICPVGTILGFLSRYAWFKHRIDTQKCNSCGLCARNCKASCIDPTAHQIDYSRCVSCFDCIDHCSRKAISFSPKSSATNTPKASKNSNVPKTSKVSKAPIASKTAKSTAKQPASPLKSNSRRQMLASAGFVFVASTLRAQQVKVDGGLAFIEDAKIPARKTPIIPPGAVGQRHFSRHCTGCQLCVSACPNRVLRPSNSADRFMQPELSFERGYCRPECVKCSEVCPAGAFHPITTADKSATQIGHAVWIEKNCVALTTSHSCGNCARHCPTGAIIMVHRQPEEPSSPLIPAINTERCIGCGACEHLCPARPFAAIYVEGNNLHRTI